MKIALGAFLLSGQPGYRQAGVHHYAKNLLKALAAQPQRDLAWTTFIGPGAAAELTPDEHRALDVRAVARNTESPARRILFEQRELSGQLRALNAAAYHGLGFAAPLRAPCPTLVSVMDLSFITHPHTHKRVNRAYLSLITRLSCQRARRVITISEWTKRDVVARFGIDAARVDAIPLGVDHDRFAPPTAAQIDRFRAEHGIGPRSVFFLGSIEPRKNLVRLIDAFAQLPPDAQLYLGGSLAWKFDDTLARIAAHGLAARVTRIGHIAPEALPLWYAACDVFVLPSLYEGFGLPALEAMACGAAVVVSDVSSLPEVVGDAALRVDPLSTPAIASALTRVLDDAALRAQLRAAARARAQLVHLGTHCDWHHRVLSCGAGMIVTRNTPHVAPRTKLLTYSRMRQCAAQSTLRAVRYPHFLCFCPNLREKMTK